MMTTNFRCWWRAAPVPRVVRPAAASNPGLLLEITVARDGVPSTRRVAVGRDTVLVPAWTPQNGPDIDI